MFYQLGSIWRIPAAAMLATLTLACGSATEPIAPTAAGRAAPAQPGSPLGAAGAEAQAATAPSATTPGARPPGPAQRLAVGVPAKSLNFLPLYLGQEAGIFGEEGLDLELTVMPSETAVAGIMSGSLDYTGGVSSSLRSAVVGVPVRVAGFITVQPTFYLVSKPEIRQVADLRNKVISTSSIGSTTTAITRLAVARAGLDPQGDINLLSAGNTANAYSALLTGQVDAAVLSVPYNVQAERDGYYPLLYAGDVTSSPESGIGATQDRLRSNPEQVKRVLRGLLKTTRYIRDNRPETVELITRDFDLERSLADGAYETMVRAYSPNGEMDRAALEQTLSEYRAEANVTQEVTVEDATDYGPLRQAQRELGL